jgi:hypothetical protein
MCDVVVELNEQDAALYQARMAMLSDKQHTSDLNAVGWLIFDAAGEIQEHGCLFQYDLDRPTAPAVGHTVVVHLEEVEIDANGDATITTVDGTQYKVGDAAHPDSQRSISSESLDRLLMLWEEGAQFVLVLPLTSSTGQNNPTAPTPASIPDTGQAIDPTASELEVTQTSVDDFLTIVELGIEGMCDIVVELNEQDAARVAVAQAPTAGEVDVDADAEYLEVIGAFASANADAPPPEQLNPPPLLGKEASTDDHDCIEAVTTTTAATTTASTAAGHDCDSYVSPPPEMVLQEFIPCLTVEENQSSSKFVAPVMVLGKNTLSAQGLATIMGVPPKTYRDISSTKKVEKIIEEFKRSGTAEDNANVAGLLNGTYANPKTPRDVLPSVVEVMEASPEVAIAGLQMHHVLALRLYTTSSYKSINNPMRQQPYPQLPHPFAGTLYVEIALL